MDLSVGIAGKTYRVGLDRPHSLAIALEFDGPQPNFFGAAKARARPLESGGFIGDTRQGGSCNVVEISLAPHCNGTHTESVGHLLAGGPAAFEALPQSLMPAVLISVSPVPAAATNEACRPAAEEGDALITRAALAKELAGYVEDELTALVVRTLPNDVSKKAAQYGDRNRPPYFTADAIGAVLARGVRHLLVDIPSIDKMHDEGRLTNHHIFWGVPEGARDRAPGTRPGTRPDTRPDTNLGKTVTEMVFAAASIADGLYLLDLQIPALATDAVPSRPVLYPLS